jgi:hypothetical protein
VIALLAVVAAVATPALPVEHLRYERMVRPAGRGPVELVPDGSMYAHAREDFSDVRIADARGRAVPWRTPPRAPAALSRRLRVLNSGRRAGAAVALVDRGPETGIVDRVTLDLPDGRFVGSVTAFGSDDRSSWTRLSTTEIYSVGGATPARSTTALMPPTDFRYLELRATNVTRIDGVTVEAVPQQQPLVLLPARVRAGASVIVVDLGRRVPVDELRISAAAPRYDRSFTVSAGPGLVAAGRLVRVGRARATVVPLAVRARVLRIRIVNGDDSPLTGIRVEALAHPRTLLLEGGHRGPFTLYYGGPVRAPVYEFARLPRAALALDRTQRGALGPERVNPLYRVVDTRSFVARNRSLVTAALALAALAVLAAGGLALRRTTR